MDTEKEALDFIGAQSITINNSWLVFKKDFVPISVLTLHSPRIEASKVGSDTKIITKNAKRIGFLPAKPFHTAKSILAQSSQRKFPTTNHQAQTIQQHQQLQPQPTQQAQPNQQNQNLKRNNQQIQSQAPAAPAATIKIRPPTQKLQPQLQSQPQPQPLPQRTQPQPPRPQLDLKQLKSQLIDNKQSNPKTTQPTRPSAFTSLNTQPQPTTIPETPATFVPQPVGTFQVNSEAPASFGSKKPSAFVNESSAFQTNRSAFAPDNIKSAFQTGSSVFPQQSSTFQPSKFENQPAPSNFFQAPKLQLSPFQSQIHQRPQFKLEIQPEPHKASSPQQISTSSPRLPSILNPALSTVPSVLGQPALIPTPAKPLPDQKFDDSSIRPQTRQLSSSIAVTPAIPPKPKVFPVLISIFVFP